MASLPNELLLQVLGDVGYPGLLQLCQTNRQLRDLCSDESLWRQLANREFPELRLKPGSTWRQAYESRWHQRQQVHRFANQLVRDHLLANPRYARLDVMTADIVKLLTDFIAEHRESKIYSHDKLIEVAMEIFEILSGLKSEYIGSESRDLDPRVNDMDLEIQGAIETFLQSLGYMNEDEVKTENTEPEDESGEND